MTAQTPPADLFDRYRDAPSLSEAEAALEEIAASQYAREVLVGEAFDELASCAIEEKDYGAAVRLQRRAVELGTEHPRLSREMLAWYLLKDGQTVAGEAEFAALRREFDDPDILLTIGNARSDAGREEDALAAFDEVLRMAKELDDPELVDEAREERRWTREELGLAPDEDDRLAGTARARRRFQRIALSLAWFPRDARDDVLARWPDLEEDLADPDAYCRTIERKLRKMQQETGQRPSVAPLDVDGLVEFAAADGLDPDDGVARARFAAELHRRGEAIPWPPSRNESCWCGSGRKYKRCCGRA
jgi:hypothetical protein